MKKKLLVFITLILSVVCLFTFTGCDEAVSAGVSTSEYLKQFRDAGVNHMEHFDGEDNFGDIKLKLKESGKMSAPVELTVLDENDSPITKEYTNSSDVDVTGVIEVKTIDNVTYLYTNYVTKRVEKTYDVVDNKVVENVKTINETETYYFGLSGEDYVATYNYTTDDPDEENEKFYTKFDNVDSYNNKLYNELEDINNLFGTYNGILIQVFGVEADTGNMKFTTSFSKADDLYVGKLYTTTFMNNAGLIIPPLLSVELTIKNNDKGLVNNRLNMEVLSEEVNISINSIADYEYKSSLTPLTNPIEGFTEGYVSSPVRALIMEIGSIL